VELLRARLGDDSVRPLLAALVEEYRSRFGSGHDLAIADIEVFDPPAEDFDPPGGLFLVLVEDGQTLSGGGFRRLSADTCEVRRMWTAPACRGRGLASSILDALESAALCQGYRRVRLETAPGQLEALSLYRDRGYHEIPVYGRYEVAVALERELRTD
jgi:GNAT superfamily N-acetyltransferase